MSSRRAVFFDRDGVINRSPGEGYVLRPEDFVLQEGLIPALQVLREAGVRAIVVTSQKGVGKGLMSRETLEAIHRRLADELAAGGVGVDAIYAHLGDGGPDDYPPKPDPTMILAAAERFSLDLRQCWLVGDADRDIAMGQAANLAGTIRIRGEKPIAIEADYTLDSLPEITELFRKFYLSRN